MRACPLLVVIAGFVIAGLVLAGCESRPPLNRGNAVAAADSLLIRDHHSWGNPSEVLRPGAADAHGHRWWQVRYPAGGSGTDRIVLVDDATGWARLAPPGYRPSVVARSRPVDPAAVELVSGEFVLLVAPEQPAERESEMRIDVAELNRLASRTGLFPAFSLRQERDGRATIVYGWADGHGMLRDESVRDWLALRTRFTDSRWVDLRE